MSPPLTGWGSRRRRRHAQLGGHQGTSEGPDLFRVAVVHLPIERGHGDRAVEGKAAPPPVGRAAQAPDIVHNHGTGADEGGSSRKTRRMDGHHAIGGCGEQIADGLRPGPVVLPGPSLVLGREVRFARRGDDHLQVRMFRQAGDQFPNQIDIAPRMQTGAIQDRRARAPRERHGARTRGHRGARSWPR